MLGYKLIQMQSTYVSAPFAINRAINLRELNNVTCMLNKYTLG